MEETHIVGSTWADFARDLLAFARDDPISFFVVFAPIAAVVVGSAWWLYPRFTKTAQEYYQFQLEKHRLQRDREPLLPLEGRNNDDS